MDDAQRLAEIREREKAATPGPWHDEEEGMMAAAPFVVPPDINHSVFVLEATSSLGMEQVWRNRAFAATAREYIPWLLEKVEDLHAEVERLREANENNLAGWSNDRAGLCRKAEGLRGIIQNLRALRVTGFDATYPDTVSVTLPVRCHQVVLESTLGEVLDSAVIGKAAEVAKAAEETTDD